jgi:hypothetical protein
MNYERCRQNQSSDSRHDKLQLVSLLRFKPNTIDKHYYLLSVPNMLVYFSRYVYYNVSGIAHG